ncbi:MAG: sugar phosphate isomerase/epimerase [Ruminococcaceae bacterium]|nr:sugar phosphate isomerase/epimerase [Oscillospiraceae bacterium]
MKNSIGVIYQLADVLSYGSSKLEALGAECVQLQCFTPELLTEENALKVKSSLDGKVRISSFWAGWSGPQMWNFTSGPSTLGLVPQSFRAMRLKELCKGADFAAMLGVKNMATHVGFIPENPSTEAYRDLCEAIRYIVLYCKDKGLNFNFETGQETPVTLMRMITDIGEDNVGINLDPANLILYGKGNPVDALDIFKGRINGVHVKDGNYPTSFYNLGEEKVVGEGSVNFPIFLPKLINQGYTGDLYIEREISGEQQITDIKKTFDYVRNILGSNA